MGFRVIQGLYALYREYTGIRDINTNNFRIKWKRRGNMKSTLVQNSDKA